MNIYAEDQLDLKQIAVKQNMRQLKAKKLIDAELGAGTYDRTMSKVHEIANQKNFVKAFIDYNKHLFTTAKFSTTEDKQKNNIIILLLVLAVNTAGGYILWRLLKPLLLKRYGINKIPTDLEITMASVFAGLVSPFTEEAAKAAAKKYGDLETFLNMFNAVEATMYIMQGNFKPSIIISRLYCVIAHNLSGVVLHREDLTVQEKTAINVGWHLFNNVVAVIPTAMVLLASTAYAYNVAEARINSKPIDYKAKEKIAMRMHGRFDANMNKLARKATPIAMASLPLGLGTGYLLTKNKDKKND